MGASCPSRVATSEVPPNLRHPEATMELRMRMNVLAALLSFGFVAAIVFGMI